MTAREIILEIMKNQSMSSTVLAQKMGYNHTSGVSERLRGSNGMKVEMFCRFANALGCEIIIKDGSGKEYTLGTE